jgi:hypothetical protein
MQQNTIQHFLTLYFDKYKQQHGMPLYQIKACEKLMQCRTEALGGHAVYCENDHLNGVWYNSCKHRSCPQCQALRSEHWLQKQEALLLDCQHHHWIFTLPHELHEIWHFNRELCFSLLFKAVGDTLKKLSADPKYLGAQPGFLLAFHSWARNLVFHPHIHCVISHGGLDKQGQWQTPKRECLLPAKVLAEIFRGKFLAGIRAALDSKTLAIPTNESEQRLRNLCNQWGRKDWVVHCVDAHKQGKGVAEYLSRYISGGAIRNSQILNISDDTIHFRYKSHQTKKTEYLTLSHEAFMQRLLSHIVLPGKKQCQVYGLYHHCCREKLNQARAHLGQAACETIAVLSWQDFLASKEKKPMCKQCGLALTKLRDIRELEEDEKSQLHLL